MEGSVIDVLLETLRKFPSTTKLELRHDAEKRLLVVTITDKGEMCSRGGSPDTISAHDLEMLIVTMCKCGAKNAWERAKMEKARNQK